MNVIDRYREMYREEERRREDPFREALERIGRDLRIARVYSASYVMLDDYRGAA